MLSIIPRVVLAMPAIIRLLTVATAPASGSEHLCLIVHIDVEYVAGQIAALWTQDRGIPNLSFATS